MSASMVDVNFLDVGQGSSCYVEIYEDKGGIDEITHTLLFDLGSMNHSGEAGGPSIDFIYDSLKTMPGGPVIDVLVVSHKDADHVNLLIPLVKKFAKGVLTIKEIYYSGKQKWYGNLFTAISNWCKNTPALDGLLISGCGYGGSPKTWTPLWSNLGVGLYLIMANTPSYSSEKRGKNESFIVDKPNGDRVNTMSAVCSVYFNGRSYIISGDATYATMVETNSALSGLSLNYIQALSLPHHGSRKTTFGLSRTDAIISKLKLQSIKTFAGIFNAITLIASADTKHSHPSLEVMELFYDYSDKTKIWYYDSDLRATYGKNWHYVTAYIDLDITYPDSSPIPMSHPPYESFPSKMNIYSTLYCYDKALFSYPPAAKLPKKKKNNKFPWGVSWYYRDDYSSLSLHKFNNRDGSLLNLKKKRDSASPEAVTEETTGAPTRPQSETRRIVAPASGASAPAFSHRFGRRVW